MKISSSSSSSRHSSTSEKQEELKTSSDAIKSPSQTLNDAVPKQTDNRRAKFATSSARGMGDLRKARKPQWKPILQRNRPENVKQLIFSRDLHPTAYSENDSSSSEGLSKTTPTTAGLPEAAEKKTPSGFPSLKKLKSPRFGGLNLPRSKTKSEKSRNDYGKPYSADIKGPLSPYEVGNAIHLPKAEEASSKRVAVAIESLMRGRNKAETRSRILNMLYCATGGSNTLGNSASFPEIKAYAKFLGELDEVSKTIYVNDLRDALMPYLESAEQKALDAAFYQRGGLVSFQGWLATQLDQKRVELDEPDEVAEPEELVQLDADVITAPIQVTMDNVAKVIDDTAGVPGITDQRRVMNLIYCAAGGKDVVEEPELCPETGAFAQSLINLAEETRLACVNDLIAKLKRHIPQMQMNRLDGASLPAIKQACASLLGDQS